MKFKIWIILSMLFLPVQYGIADLSVVREVIIAPKKGRVVANIGSVNQSYNISMQNAKVTIWVGKVPERSRDPIDVSVHAVFLMKNSSPDIVTLTVGFPVSNSEYSAFGFKSFTVKTDMESRSVFKRITGYPGKMLHTWVSGPDNDSYKILPDLADLVKKDNSSQKLESRKLFRVEKIGEEEYQSLMVWKETFNPGQSRKIEVNYTIEIPKQKNKWKQKKMKGNYKGIWPQEANNLPLDFLKSIPYKKKYYFFDYYLVSGASWKGEIGEEIITLNLDKTWQGHNLHSNLMNRLVKPSNIENNYHANALTYTYILRNDEPTENLYFALERP